MVIAEQYWFKCEYSRKDNWLWKDR